METEEIKNIAEIEYVDIKKLIPYDKNPRVNEKAVEYVVRSIKANGFNQPIVCDQNYIVCVGHTRLKAAKELGLKSVPCYKKAMTREQFIAYNLADNKTSEYARWDDDLLKENVTELYKLDDDLLYGTAFSEDELNDLIIDEDFLEERSKQQEREDHVPEVAQNEKGVKLGDLYQLGEHRLLCGDSTCKDTVEKLMGGEKADMVFTDIPYNISQKTNGLRELDYGEWDKDVHDIGLKTMFITDYADSFYFFCGDEQLSELLIAFKEYKFSTRTFVWHKTNPTVMNGDKLWLPSQELCAYAKKPKAIFNKSCEHAFYEGAPNGNRVHPNQKPIELVQKCIEASSNKSVIDLFCGSGSTLIACEKTNRKCFMMELDPHYCSVIIKRWEEYTGKKAKKIK